MERVTEPDGSPACLVTRVLAQEIARAAPDVSPRGLDALGAMSPAARRHCADLLDHRRTLLSEEICIAAALRDAGQHLDSLVRREWLACVHGQVPHPGGVRACEAAQADVERIERDLVLVRGAIRGVAEDLAALLSPSRPTRASA